MSGKVTSTSEPLGAPARAPGRIAGILVCYGPPDHLARCLVTLSTQFTDERIRLILVDNNPPEQALDLRRLVPSPGAEQELVAIAPGANIGFGCGVNVALKHVREELVLVMNPDILLDGRALDEMLTALDAAPEAAAVGPRLMSHDGAAPFPLRVRPQSLPEDLVGLAGWTRSGAVVSWPTGAAHSANRRVQFLSGSCFLARRSVLEQVGGFDPRFFLYYEDADLWRRVTGAGWQLQVVPSAIARHVHGASWLDPVARQITALRGALVYHDKYKGVPGSLVFRLGLLLAYVPRLVLGGVLSATTSRRSRWDAGMRRRLVREVVKLAFGPSEAAPRGTPGRATTTK